MVERSGDWQSSSRPAQRLSFSYDSQSRRIRKVVEEQSVISNQPSEIRNYEVVSDRRFLYDGWNLIAEFEMNPQHSSFSLHTSYVWGLDLSGTEQGAGGVGGLLLSRRIKIQDSGIQNQEWVVPTYDGNGNVLALYDLNSQTLTARYEYGPFGETLVAEGPAAAENAFRFSTKYTDEETGLLYYGYRYYSADLGRWLNRDPIAERGGLNLYGMVENDSVNWVDLLGLLEIHIKEVNDPAKDCPGNIAILIGGAQDSKTKVARNAVPHDVYAGWGEKGEVRNFVEALHKCCPNAKVSITGHSYGGDTAVDLTRSIPKIPIDRLTTLDPVSRVRNTKTKPSNVSTWNNIYQDNSISSSDNTVAGLGGHWGSVNGADTNKKVNTTHANAGIMFKEVLDAFNNAGYGQTARTGSDWDKGPETKGGDDPEGPFKNCQCNK